MSKMIDIPRGRITPSKQTQSIWRGTPMAGSNFTQQQAAGYEREKKDGKHGGRLPEHPDLFIAQFWGDDPKSRLPKHIKIHCPLLATTATGRLVITPSGRKKWIDREGLNK